MDWERLDIGDDSRTNGHKKEYDRMLLNFRHRGQNGLRNMQRMLG